MGHAPGVFGEKLTVSGVPFTTLGVGSRLRLGNDVVLRITQIGKHFQQPERVEHITGEYLMAHAGVFAKVDRGGNVRRKGYIKGLCAPCRALNLSKNPAQSLDNYLFPRPLRCDRGVGRSAPRGTTGDRGHGERPLFPGGDPRYRRTRGGPTAAQRAWCAHPTHRSGS